MKDARYFGLRDATEPMSYQALWRSEAGSRVLTIRSTADPKPLIEAVRRELRALDATVPVLQARTIEQQMDNNLLVEKLIATLSGFFGLLAMLLASVGLYGVMAQSVTVRTREMGIRMALGADRSSVLWMVLKEALVLVAIGSVVGVPAGAGGHEVRGVVPLRSDGARPVDHGRRDGVPGGGGAVCELRPGSPREPARPEQGTALRVVPAHAAEHRLQEGGLEPARGA